MLKLNNETAMGTKYNVEILALNFPRFLLNFVFPCKYCNHLSEFYLLIYARCSVPELQNCLTSILDKVQIT